jgi:vitamin B12 transporter
LHPLRRAKYFATIAMFVWLEKNPIQNKFCFLLILLFTLPAFASDIEEKIEVKGLIFSRELRSKNIMIIAAEEIKTWQIKNVADLFSFFTAFNVSRRGPAESSYDLSMRGSHFEQVLVLLDGVPFNNPQSGHFNTDFPFTLDDIERVEIVRGGSSTTYGAGAFAGMVNIILKKKSAAEVALSGGSNNFFSGKLAWGKTTENLDYHLSANRSNGRGFYPGREFDQTNLTGSVSYKFANNQLDFFFGYLAKNFGANGFYEPAPSIEDSQTAFSQIKFQKTKEHSRYQLGYAWQNHDDHFILDRYRPDYFQNQSRTDSHFLFLSGSTDWQSFHLASGVEFKKESLRSTSMGNFTREQSAVYMNANYSPGKDSVDLGIRCDFIAAASGQFIYCAGFSHRFSEHTLGKISLGRSFRVPTFTELHYRSPKNFGNNNLKPETSFNYESSLTWFSATRTIDFSLFYRRQIDTIDWIRHETSDPWQAVNLRKNDLLGIELTQQWHRGNLLLLIAIEKMWVLNEQDGFQSKYGLRFPDFSLKANLSFALTRNFTVANNYLYKHIFRTPEKGHFLNTIFSYRLHKCELSLRIENIFNTIIEEIPGIAVDGRCIYLGFAFH